MHLEEDLLNFFIFWSALIFMQMTPHGLWTYQPTSTDSLPTCRAGLDKIGCAYPLGKSKGYHEIMFLFSTFAFKSKSRY